MRNIHLTEQKKKKKKLLQHAAHPNEHLVSHFNQRVRPGEIKRMLIAHEY